MRNKTAQTIAANLTHLIREHEMELMTVAERSGVSLRSVTYMKAGTGNPTVESVDAVARVFGLTGWHMMNPHLIEDLANNEWLDRIKDAFNLAPPHGQDVLRKATEAVEMMGGRRRADRELPQVPDQPPADDKLMAG